MNDKPSILEIAKGLANKEFIFHYQPIISLVTGQICGAEALIRWQKPDGRLIPPAAFIPLAETAGFISEITLEMLPVVVRDLMRVDVCDPLISFSFNTSAKDFGDTRVVDTISSQLAQHAVALGRLNLEITETAFLPLNATTQQALFDIRDLGVKIVLNDFSAGHSTFQYLSLLPFSSLKIAMPLVQRVAKSKFDFRLLRHLVGLGHQLHYDVIAEGVEDAELHHLILSTGCSSAQGYYYAHPLPLEEFMALVEQHRTWVGYPFGLVYLAQMDMIDYARDILREALILHSNPDEPSRQRARARLPELGQLDTAFGKWYYGDKNYVFDQPENFETFGREYEKFQTASVELIELAEQRNPPSGALEQKIAQFGEHSKKLTTILAEIATSSLVKPYLPLKHPERAVTAADGKVTGLGA
jgi:EAL domain-containing protein (putative c-di-GMP-specific phosphodiesterase class I)